MNTSSHETRVRRATTNRKRAVIAGATSLGLVVAAGGALMLANPANAVPTANSICHAKGNGGYVLIGPDDDGVASGHSDHENDIIPNSRNWRAPYIAIWNNNCVVPSPSPTSSPTSSPTASPTVTPSPTVSPTVTPTPTPTEGGSALVPICLPIGEGKYKMDDVMISALLQKPALTVKALYLDSVFAQLTPESYSWLGESTVPAQGDQVLLGNNCLLPTPAVTVTAPGTNTTNTVTVPGPTVTVTATPTPTASAVPPVAVAPVDTPSVAPSRVPSVALAPVAAAVPTAVNAGDGSSQNKPMSPLGIVLMALAGIGVLYAALKLSTQRPSTSSH